MKSKKLINKRQPHQVKVAGLFSEPWGGLTAHAVGWYNKIADVHFMLIREKNYNNKL